MSKIYGLLSEFALVRQDASRTVIGFCLDEADEGHKTWHEVYFYKKQYPQPSIDQVKAAVKDDLNSFIQEAIMEGFVWNGHKVWLSLENQLNYMSDFNLALQTGGENLPVKYKFGTDDEPDYYTFERVDELKDFWTRAKKHINTVIDAGRLKKDGIDWNEYERALESLSNSDTTNGKSI